MATYTLAVQAAAGLRVAHKAEPIKVAAGLGVAYKAEPTKELHAVFQGTDAALRHAARLEAQEEALQAACSSVRLLEQECWDLREKREALDEDLADRLRAGEAAERHLTQGLERLRRDFASQHREEEQAVQAFRRLMPEVEQLEGRWAVHSQKVQEVAAKPLNQGRGRLPGVVGPPLPTGGLSEARSAAITELQGFQMTPDVQLLAGAAKELEEKRTRFAVRAKELRCSLRLWQRLCEYREARAEEAQARQVALKRRYGAAEAQAAALLREAAEAGSQSSAVCGLAARAACSLRRAARLRRAASASPVVASLIASLWWLALGSG